MRCNPFPLLAASPRASTCCTPTLSPIDYKPNPLFAFQPLRSFTEGIYVLYTYTANPACGQAVQRYLSTPTAGNEVNVLRHMTFLGNSA